MNLWFAHERAASRLITKVDCGFVDAFSELQRSLGYRQVVFNSRSIPNTEWHFSGVGLEDLLFDDVSVTALEFAEPMSLADCNIPFDQIYDLDGHFPLQPFDVHEDVSTPIIIFGRAIRAPGKNSILFEYFMDSNEVIFAPPRIIEGTQMGDEWVFVRLPIQQSECSSTSNCRLTTF